MDSVTHIIVYLFLFVSLYFEVFLLVTYLEKRSEIDRENEFVKQPITHYPSVTILVPCWNEENTLTKTMDSLLDLEYPKEKLKIIAIDDGSTDTTWNVMQRYTNNPHIEIIHKENGGKHTALNLGLSKTTSDLVGCLDADSYVDRHALKNIVPYFTDKKIMAVTPSVKVWKPQTIIQMIQKVEYGWGILLRKMFSYLGAMYVTPGPFSIFRREVFENLGGYRHAHQTEDMEIAMRMQANHYTIVNSHNALVYTVAPRTLKKLYTQRVRWSSGFIKNIIDYRFVFFKKKYGNLGMFILPMATLSVGTGMYIIGTLIHEIILKVADEYIKIQTIGFHFDMPSFSLFSINTEFIAIASFLGFIGTLILILLSRKMAEGKIRIGMDMVYYLSLYAFIAPLWLTRAVWNALFSINATWR